MQSRDKRIYLAYTLAKKRLIRKNPITASFLATTTVSRQFGISIFTVQRIVKTKGDS